MERRIDLHIHTTMSDGELTPIQVVDEAYKNGVSVISIADHDTIEAYTKELFAYAERKKIKIIPAVEISTKSKKNGIHVLGYNFNLEDKQFKEKLKNIRNARHDYLQKVSKKLNELGYIVNIEKLNQIDSVTKAHISLDIINNKKNNDILLNKFGHMPNKGEFIETIMNEDCPAYVKKETINPKQATDMIRDAGGKAVLAHPVAYIHEDGLIDEDILNIIKHMKPDGLEANYIYVDKYNNTIDEIEKWNKFAIKNNLFVTAGSDFHCNDGIRPTIGFVNTDFILSENEIEKIISNLMNDD